MVGPIDNRFGKVPEPDRNHKPIGSGSNSNSQGFGQPNPEISREKAREFAFSEASLRENVKQRILDKYPAPINVKITKDNFHPENKLNPFGPELLVGDKSSLDDELSGFVELMDWIPDPKDPERRILGFIDISLLEALGYPLEEDITTPSKLSKLQQELKIPIFVVPVNNYECETVEDVINLINTDRPMSEMLLDSTPRLIKMYAEDIDLGYIEKNGKPQLIANSHDPDPEEDGRRVHAVSRYLLDEVKDWGPIQVTRILPQVKLNFRLSPAYKFKLQESKSSTDKELQLKPVYRGTDFFHPTMPDKFRELANQAKLIDINNSSEGVLSIFEPFIDIKDEMYKSYVIRNMRLRGLGRYQYVNSLDGDTSLNKMNR